MRRLRRGKAQRQKQVLILGTLALISVLTVGYAAFQTNITLTAKGNVKPTVTYTVDQLKETAVSEGDGLYDNEDGTYTYKGANPDNYITLGTDMYRIMEIDKDGNLKVIRDATISLPWDPGYSTSISGITNSSSIKGTRYAGLSSNTTDYCVSASTKENNYYGCKAWGSKYSTLDRNGNSILNQNTQIAQMPWEAGSTTLRNLPEYDSYINAYLNGEYYPCDASISGCENGKKKLTAWYETNVASTLQSKIVDHLWNIGPIKSNNSDLATDISQAEAYKWRGKVGLMNVIDYVKASTNPACTNVKQYNSNSSCYNNSNTHNWLYANGYRWTMAPLSYSSSRSVWYASSGGHVLHSVASDSFASRPVFYLANCVQLTGSGTSQSPYSITNNNCTANTDSGQSSQGGSGGSGSGGGSSSFSGTVYAINTNNTITKNSSTLQDVGTTYSSCSATGKTACLRYTIENNTVTGAEACFIKGGNEYCLTGWVDECLWDDDAENAGENAGCTYTGETSVYNLNKGILNTAFTETNACTDHGSDIFCNASGVDARAYSEGFVYVNVGSWYCNVHSDGYAGCDEYGGG